MPIDHQRIGIGADMARQAAQRGYLAVAVEQLGFGTREERTLTPRSADRLIDAANHALLLGRTLQGEKCWDLSAAIDWLLGPDGRAALPVAIDPARLFLYGHSSGGSTALFAAALDTRIKGVVCSGSVGRFRATAGTRRNPNGELIVPGLLNWLEARRPDRAHRPAPLRRAQRPRRPYLSVFGGGRHGCPRRGLLSPDGRGTGPRRRPRRRPAPLLPGGNLGHLGQDHRPAPLITPPAAPPRTPRHASTPKLSPPSGPHQPAGTGPTTSPNGRRLHPCRRAFRRGCPDCRG